jgi:alpha-2-macroglobulin-like protein
MKRSALGSLALLLPLAACSDEPNSPPDQGPPEILENGSGAVQESGLRATIRGTEVELSFPITRKSGDLLEGVLSAELIDVSKPESPVIARATKRIEQRDASSRHSLVLTGLAADIERPKTSAIVIAWRADLDQGVLRGRRSLYAALGKLEVELRGATEVPVGNGVPFRIIVRDPDTLSPKAGALVAASLEAEEGREAIALFSGTTDEKGELLSELSLPEGIESGKLRVEVKDGTAEAWASSAVRSVVNQKIALSSDKTIYKPGQVIELRALALEGADKSPLASREITFEALDAKGNKVFRRRVSTDEYGVAALGIPTDSRVNEGLWTIRASIGQARAEKKLPVTRYVLPKMKVTVTPERAYAIAGEAVRGRVEARYVFGLPVSRANVSISIKDSSQGVIAATSVQADEEGRATFELPLPAGAGAERSEDGEAAISVEAEFTDTAGQHEIGASSMPLVRGPIVIKALTEASALLPGVENLIWIIVADPIGRPVVADLTVNGLGPLSPLRTDQDGVAELRFTPSQSTERVSIEVRATDGAQRTHTRNIELAAGRSGLLLVRTDKAVYRRGETATIEVLGSMEAGRVYLDVYRAGEGVDARTVDLGAGRAEILLPITEEMRGLVVLDAFALAGSGEVVRGAQRVLVDPEDRLDIALEPEQRTYGPGEEARVRVRVTDASGAPRVASIGMTAVDEAVFALGGEPDDNLRVLFNLDRRLLPQELRVLGRGAADLFTGDPTSSDRFARLLFASAKTAPSPGFEYNSVREELPRVREAITGKVRRDVVLALKGLISWAKGTGELTKQKAESGVLPAITRLYDPFAQHYQAKLGDANEWDWQRLIVTSFGPDELEGTPDDVEIELWYGWIQWADESAVDEEGNFQGGFAEDADGGPVRGGAPAAGAPPQAPAPEDKSASGGEGAKVRSDFRETVYVNPTLITDATGQASVSFPLADSITTWRISAQGSTRDGKIGAARAGIRTFQDFFVDFSVPATLTKGDVIELPAVVYNYLETAATVRVTITPAAWFELVSAPEQSVNLGPSEVRSVKFTVRALAAGEHSLMLSASAGTIQDAIVREARVLPGGQADDQSFSDKLNGTRDHTIEIPADAIEGGTEVSLVLTPGFAREAVAGTEALLKEPNGCFEQTTSTAWPNTIVTTYLDTTGQLTPELREQAFALVLRGYQRLLTFESPTRGFNWWGDNTPGNRILSAIMLWHLKDMEGIIETDEAVRDRTLAWLLEQQRADGSWPSGDALHAGNEVLGTSDARTTAFIAWALAHTGWADDAVRRAIGYLSAQLPDESDLYANALAANAFAVADPTNPAATTLFTRLDAHKQEGGEGRFKWPTEAPSWTGAGGDVAAIETTGLVAYGFLKARAMPEDAAGAVRFIVANKDSVGSWYNTQATMNALRALLAASSPQGSEAEGTLTVAVNGQTLPAIAITRADGDLHRTIDLTGHVHSGANDVRLTMAGTGELSYRLSRRAHRPMRVSPPAPLGLEVAYDTTAPRVGQQVHLSVAATYRGQGVRDQVMVRVGRAPGFEPRIDQLERIVADGRVARFEVNERDITLYLMGMQGGQVRDLSFDLTPTLVIQGEVPASAIYAYYEPTIRTDLSPVAVRVTP